MNNLYAVYFSATDTTARCVRAICRGFAAVPKSEINLADVLDVPFPDFNQDDVVVVAAPVYGGRLPAKAADCVKCGKCVANCPTGAIPADRPYATDPEVCISCGRCIHVCSTGARRHGGATYRIIGTIFKIGFSKRKKPEWTVAK